MIFIQVAVPLNPLGEDIEGLSKEDFNLFAENVTKLLTEITVDPNADSTRFFAAVSCIRSIVTRNVEFKLLMDAVQLIHGE